MDALEQFQLLRKITTINRRPRIIGIGTRAGYYNNKYYKQGWQDGQHHKHKNHKWKNDADRQAYEAGYNHGDHGEQWKDHR